VRHVWGTLVHRDTDEPAYSFAVSFDEKQGGVVGDLLTLTHCRSDEKSIQWLPCNKLGSLTEGFISSSASGIATPGLASVDWAGSFVELMQAVGDSDEARLNGEPSMRRVFFSSTAAQKRRHA